MRITLPAVVAMLFVIGVVSCSGGDGGGIEASDGKPSGSIRAIWVESQVIDDAVAIALRDVRENWHTHFAADLDGKTTNFMAYSLDGDIHVGANVCPPCRSVGFSLDGDRLLCDSCGTVFDAKTGSGIRGACKAFPKAEVDHQVVGGQIVMQQKYLAVAYENTTEAGWP